MASGPPVAGDMTGRIKRLLLEPKVEWQRIDAEPMTVDQIVRGWVLPLAAIGPVAGVIGKLVFGYSFLGITYRPSVTSAVIEALVGYGMAVGGMFVLAWLIDMLAPSFGAAPNRVAATKVAAFSATAGYLAGVFQLIPSLAFLGLLGLYSLYLLWIGLPMLMRAPADRASTYTVVTLIAALMVGLLVGGISSRLVPALTGQSTVISSPGGSITVTG